jgi:predicted oxidoreductase
LAYRPLAGGILSSRATVAGDPHLKQLLATLQAQAEKRNATIAQIALAWLLAHPARVLPLVGSIDPEHIREAVGAVAITLSREDWFELWIAARGHPVP